MKHLAYLFLIVLSLAASGCSETTRDSMARDVNRAARDIDEKLD